MKKDILDEILTESTVLKERPYSRTQSAIDNAKGTVKGVFGSGQVEQGAAKTGQVANGLWRQFKSYLGQVYGSAPDVVSFDDVENFFEANGLDTSVLGNNTRRQFSPKDVGELLLVAAREYAKYPASQRQQNANNPPPAPQGNNSGTPPAPAQGGNGTPPSPAPAPAPQGNPPAPAPQGGNGNSLQSVLAGLTQAQRDALITLIS